MVLDGNPLRRLNKRTLLDPNVKSFLIKKIPHALLVKAEWVIECKCLSGKISH